jgi:hypothetical protein
MHIIDEKYHKSDYLISKIDTYWASGPLHLLGMLVFPAFLLEYACDGKSFTDVV